MELFETILEQLKKSQPLVLATVIDHSGSTPRGTGTRFLIHKNGALTGTIGGGLVEAEVIEAAKSVFENGEAMIHRYDMSKQHLTTKSMICGGTMTILIEPLVAAATNLAFYDVLQSAYQNRRKAIFIIGMTRLRDESYQLTHLLLDDGGEICDTGMPQPEVIRQLKADGLGRSEPFTVSMGDTSYWVEPLTFPYKLFLFGAGHVSRPTACLGQMAGFQTTVIDDRKELLSNRYFNDAIDLVAVDSFKNSVQNLEIDTDSFVVILTRGHTYDRIVLAQALKTEAMYIGMIGSKRKRNTIYNLLLGTGFSQLDLNRVHSPIGLAIGADTPEEIAISIVAELIKVRANRK